MEHINSCRPDLVGHLCNLVRTEQVNSCRLDLVGHLCYLERQSYFHLDLVADFTSSGLIDRFPFIWGCSDSIHFVRT